eukprot:gene2053-4611_t
MTIRFGPDEMRLVKRMDERKLETYANAYCALVDECGTDDKICAPQTETCNAYYFCNKPRLFARNLYPQTCDQLVEELFESAGVKSGLKRLFKAENGEWIPRTQSHSPQEEYYTLMEGKFPNPDDRDAWDSRQQAPRAGPHTRPAHESPPGTPRVRAMARRGGPLARLLGPAGGERRAERPEAAAGPERAGRVASEPSGLLKGKARAALDRLPAAAEPALREARLQDVRAQRIVASTRGNYRTELRLFAAWVLRELPDQKKKEGWQRAGRMRRRGARGTTQSHALPARPPPPPQVALETGLHLHPELAELRRRAGPLQLRREAPQRLERHGGMWQAYVAAHDQQIEPEASCKKAAAVVAVRQRLAKGRAQRQQAAIDKQVEGGAEPAAKQPRR